MARRAAKSKPAAPLLPLRLARLHIRLLLSTVLGLVVLAASFSLDWRTPTRLLAGWDVGVFCYLAFTFSMMTFSTVDHIRRRAAMQDEGAFAMLLLSNAAAIASLMAIVAELAIADANASYGWYQFALGMGTILLSWLFMTTIFTLHYAHEFYGERRDARIGGLEFPGKEEPDYWDFFYFAMVLAMTSQVSDVSISSRVIRRVATIHGVMAFLFNLTILALTVSMISNLIQPGQHP